MSEQPPGWATPGPTAQQPGFPPPGPGAAPGFMRPQLTPVAWNRRALGWIIDFGIQQLIGLITGAGVIITELRWLNTLQTSATTAPSPPLDMLGWALASQLVWIPFVIFVVYGRWIKGGSTGQSIGRRIAKTRLVNEATGQPIGVGMTIVRDLAHTLDQLPLYLGYLWPLWDARRQTFADKLLKTVVVDEADAPLNVRR